MRVVVWVSLLAATALTAQTRPDFSGVWQINKEKSKVMASVDAIWMKIHQSESTFVVTSRVTQNGKEEASTRTFSLGPEESTNELHGAPMKSHTAWDGRTLVVTSIVMFGNKPLRLNDRWGISDDGQTLTFDERHQFDTEPEGTSKFVMERRPAEAWPRELPPKLAEEEYKNIQVLQGLPASKLLSVMGSFTKALGVQCGYCHVGREFEKDDQAPKQTARKMLRMAAKINSDNFGGSNPVTCWTCHRGSTKPQSLPPE